MRVTIGNRVLIEGDKLHPKQDGEAAANRLGPIDEGEDGRLPVSAGTPEGMDQRERAGSKSEDKKDKSGGKGKGAKAAKSQGSVAVPTAVRVWDVHQELCLSFDKNSSNMLSDVVMHPLLSELLVC